MEKELKIIDRNLEISEKDSVVGIIYKMTNTETQKCYVGQTRSHRLNKNKYRLFGHIGRFNDHVSEAMSNKKKNQCVYLNNSIRKYGKDAFTVEILALCEIDDLDEIEIQYIKNLGTLYPNGYNLKDNIGFAKTSVENNGELKVATKRGRDYGFVHTDETIEKMKKYYEDISEEKMGKLKKTMQQSISSHFANKRAIVLADSKIDLDDNFADLIKPVKPNGTIISYTIRYKRKKYVSITGKQYTPIDVYNMLYDALKNAYEIRKNRNLTNNN